MPLSFPAGPTPAGLFRTPAFAFAPAFGALTLAAALTAAFATALPRITAALAAGLALGAISDIVGLVAALKRNRILSACASDLWTHGSSSCEGSLRSLISLFPFGSLVVALLALAVFDYQMPLLSPHDPLVFLVSPAKEIGRSFQALSPRTR